MKKTIVFALFSAFTFAAANGYCDAGVVTGSRATGPEADRHAHRAELIAKRKANSASDSETTRPRPTGESKVAKFWKNEAERSGVSQWKAPSLNPLPFFKEQDRKYKERKAAK